MLFEINNKNECVGINFNNISSYKITGYKECGHIHFKMNNGDCHTSMQFDSFDEAKEFVNEVQSHYFKLNRLKYE